MTHVEGPPTGAVDGGRSQRVATPSMDPAGRRPRFRAVVGDALSGIASSAAGPHGNGEPAPRDLAEIEVMASAVPNRRRSTINPIELQEPRSDSAMARALDALLRGHPANGNGKGHGATAPIPVETLRDEALARLRMEIINLRSERGRLRDLVGLPPHPWLWTPPDGGLIHPPTLTMLLAESSELRDEVEWLRTGIADRRAGSAAATLTAGELPGAGHTRPAAQGRAVAGGAAVRAVPTVPAPAPALAEEEVGPEPGDRGTSLVLLVLVAISVVFIACGIELILRGR